MVVKVSKAGGAFLGQINYLYEGKLETKKVQDKKPEIISHSDNLRVCYSPEDKIGRNRMIFDFINQAKNHKNYKKDGKYVGEHILSFTNEEKESLNKKALKEIVDEYINKRGLNNTQYIAVSHNDTSNLHVHIVFNRALNNGLKFDDSHEKMKSLSLGVALSIKKGYELKGVLKDIAKDSNFVHKYRSEDEDIKALQNSSEILQKARNYVHLEKLVTAKGGILLSDEKKDTVKFFDQEYKLHDLKSVFYMNREKEKEKKNTNNNPNNINNEYEKNKEIREKILKKVTSFEEFEKEVKKAGGKIEKIKDNDTEEIKYRFLGGTIDEDVLDKKLRRNSFNDNKFENNENDKLLKISTDEGKKVRIIKTKIPGFKIKINNLKKRSPKKQQRL